MTAPFSLKKVYLRISPEIFRWCTIYLFYNINCHKRIRNKKNGSWPRPSPFSSTTLWANNTDDELMKFSYFCQTIGYGISCKLSPYGTICMKCQNLFTGKKYETYLKMSSAVVLPSMLSVKSYVQTTHFHLFILFFYVYYCLKCREILCINCYRNSNDFFFITISFE